MLIPIMMKITNKKWIQYLTVVMAITYVILVAISRVLIGAHYASDVLFGLGINVICSVLIYFFVKKRGWLDVRNDKC